LSRSKARPKSRSKPKRKRVRKKAVATLVVALISISFLIPYTWYGLSNRPIVEYTFGDIGNIRSSYHLIASTENYPGTIDLVHVLIRNRGSSDISVVITVHAVNAMVSANYYGPYSEMASKLSAVPAVSGFLVVPFYISLKLQVSSFTISCQATKVLYFSTFASSMASIFGEVDPISRIVLGYTHRLASPQDYDLATKS